MSIDFRSLAGMAATMATKLLPAIVPGAGVAIEAAKKVLELGELIKPHVQDGQEATNLTVALAKLEAQVMTHADRTIASLGDRPT